MKKYLMLSLAAIAFASCSKDDITYINPDVQKYETAFVNRFGQPASTHTWGFGTAGTRAAFTRSQAAPAVLEAAQPYDEAWVANYLTTAKEPDATNSTDNYDNTTYATNWDVVNNLTGDEWALKDQLFNSGKSWEEQLAWMLANRPNWLTYNVDETYVTNFKITGTQNGSISVVATEDADGDPRTVVVTGTWNLTAEQRVGGGGKIIVANGGKINLASGANLNSVNEAQIVVLPGGEISGDGQIAFCNGTNNDLLSGNWGTINVGTFNNNGGNFFNYGTLKANRMDGGAGNSRYYNHSVISIGETGSSANIRIFNNCQFYVKNNARIRNYEGINGSALVVDGQLMFSSSADGTNDPTYVGLAGGALIKCATLYNNGTSWSGPTGTEYAALEITDKIVYLNWEQDAPQTGGYFENNIYVKAATWSNVPDGNGYQAGETSTADYKFFNIIANCTSGGTGNVTKVTEGTTEFIPKDADFVKGENGCTPGFTADVPPIIPDDPDPDDPTPTPSEYDLRVMAEDLTVSENSDFDFNDVVFDVKYVDATHVQLKVLAAGGIYPIRIAENDAYEAHALLHAPMTMVNTYAGNKAQYTADVITVTGNFGSSKGDAQFGLGVRDIKVEVSKDGGTTWAPLVAPTGKVASKIAVPVTVDWCDEYQDIDVKWGGSKTSGKFAAWVANESNKFWE